MMEYRGSTGGDEMTVQMSPLYMMRDEQVAVSCRTGRELWQLARRHVLSYRTQRALSYAASSMGMPAPSRMARKRFSNAVATVTGIMHSPSDRMIVRQLKYGNTPEGWCNQLCDEYAEMIVSIGSSLAPRGSYTPWWTVVCILVNSAVFFFMAGEWAAQQEGWVPGPSNLSQFVWPFGDESAVFSSEYLLLWGGLYKPNIVEGGEWYRWITSTVVHMSSFHLMSNMVMQVVYGMISERRYGSKLAFLVWVVSAVGGNFASAAFEPPCALLVGASGGVYGFFGFFVADSIVIWNRAKRPMLRLVLMLLVGANLTMDAHSDGKVSHAAHIGGALCGLACSIILLPDSALPVLRKVLPLLSIACMCLFIGILPLVVYSSGGMYIDCNN